MDKYGFGKSFVNICHSLTPKVGESLHVEIAEERDYRNIFPATDDIRPLTPQINKSLNYGDLYRQHVIQKLQVEPLDLSTRLSRGDQNLKVRSNSRGYSTTECSYYRNSVTTEALISLNGKTTMTLYSSEKYDTSVSNFTQQGQLKRHEVEHANEGLHKCEICYKEFKRKNLLKVHMKLHTGERPYKCETCGYASVLKSNLIRHMKLHTGERPYKCDCGYASIHKSNLTRHMKLHTEERPCSCAICGKAFAYQAALKQHMNTHSQEEPHTCDTCGKAFKWQNSLRRHMKRCTH